MAKFIVRKPGYDRRKSALAIAVTRDKAGLQVRASFAGAAMVLTSLAITAVLLLRA